MTCYKHTQIGHVIIWSLLAIILIASGGLMESLSHREPPVIVSIILLARSFCSTNSGLRSSEALCASFWTPAVSARTLSISTFRKFAIGETRSQHAGRMRYPTAVGGTSAELWTFAHR